MYTRNKSISRQHASILTKPLYIFIVNRQISKLKNSVLMLLFMLFHFTQSCAFIAYSFRYISYYSCFYRCKSTHFFKGARIWVCFFQMERKTICNSALIRHRNQRHIQHDRNPCKGGWREVVATYSLVVIYTIPFVV